MIKFESGDIVHYYYQADYNKDPSHTRSMILIIAKDNFIAAERFFFLKGDTVTDESNIPIVVFEVFRRDGDIYKKVYCKE